MKSNIRVINSHLINQSYLYKKTKNITESILMWWTRLNRFQHPARLDLQTTWEATRAALPPSTQRLQRSAKALASELLGLKTQSEKGLPRWSSQSEQSMTIFLSVEFRSSWECARQECEMLFLRIGFDQIYSVNGWSVKNRTFEEQRFIKAW